MKVSIPPSHAFFYSDLNIEDASFDDVLPLKYVSFVVTFDLKMLIPASHAFDLHVQVSVASHMTSIWSYTTYYWWCLVPVCASGTDLLPPAAALEGNWLAVVLQRGVAEWGGEGVRGVCLTPLKLVPTDLMSLAIGDFSHSPTECSVVLVSITV